MAYYSSYTSTGSSNNQALYNKPRYRHEVLVGNWFEERAAKDPSFLPLQQSKASGKEKTEKLTESKVTFKENEQPKEDPNLIKSKSKLAGENADIQDAVCTSDVLRGYYSTTYKRSYGPRHGYIYMNSAPSSARTQSLERPRLTETSTAPSASSRDITGVLDCSIPSGTRTAEECRRCEQLAAERTELQQVTGTGNSGSCLRCLQLAAL